MDLKMGFFQIKMDPESVHLTASMGPRGSFQYKRIAMGLEESPITFMRAMELAMAGLSRDEIEIYLDNIMVFSETPKEHIIRLKRVLRKLAKANLTIEPKNVNFLNTKPEYWGT
jgi:putative transposase